MNDDLPLVSLVVPAYNEAGRLAGNLAAMLACAGQAEGVRFELLVIDDGSQDDTAALVRRLAETEPRLRLLALTRNFGKEAALSAGLEHARGDAVVVLDADLQHPPTLLPRMIELWRQGFAVVEAVKRDRGDGGSAGGFFARLFYRAFQRLAGLDLAAHSDYKLLDRAVVDALIRLPERRRFFRGLVAWMGYPTASLPFDVPPREGGGSRWGRLRLLRYAIDNITGFSALPLALIGAIGAVLLTVGGGIGLIALYQKWTGAAVDGFTTVILLIVIASGALMASLGIIGLYLARIYEEIKGRPIYLLRRDPEDGRVGRGGR